VPIRTTKDGKLNLVDEKDWIECIHQEANAEEKQTEPA